MACDSQSLELLLVANGLNRLSERDLLICRAYLYCNLAGFTSATDALRVAYADGYAKVSERDLDAEYLALISSS